MKRILITLLIPLIVFSCNNIDKPKKPDNLISKDRMVDIITDISLLKAAKGINKGLLEERSINPQNYIYNKYDIDSIVFAESNNYYAYDVKEYEEIYLTVKKRLEALKTEYTADRENEKKELDSIRKAKKKERDSIKNLNLDKDKKLNSIQEKRVRKPS
jgi:hypothetical protein